MPDGKMTGGRKGVKKQKRKRGEGNGKKTVKQNRKRDSCLVKTSKNGDDKGRKGARYTHKGSKGEKRRKERRQKEENQETKT